MTDDAPAATVSRAAHFAFDPWTRRRPRAVDVSVPQNPRRPRATFVRRVMGGDELAGAGTSDYGVLPEPGQRLYTVDRLDEGGHHPIAIGSTRGRLGQARFLAEWLEPGDSVYLHDAELLEEPSDLGPIIEAALAATTQPHRGRKEPTHE